MKKEELVKDLGGLLQHIANVMASLEKEIKDAPKPAKETAFQGMVREYLCARFQKDPYETCSWNHIARVWPEKIPLVRITYNATLDLATKALLIEAGTEAITYEHRRAIEALKESKP